MECTFDIKLGQAAKDGEVELLAIKGGGWPKCLLARLVEGNRAEKKKKTRTVRQCSTNFAATLAMRQTDSKLHRWNPQ